MGIVLGVMVFGWLFWAFIKVFLFFGFVFGAFLFLAGISFALFGTITSVVVAMFRSDCLSGIQGIRVRVAGDPRTAPILNRETRKIREKGAPKPNPKINHGITRKSTEGAPNHTPKGTSTTLSDLPCG